LIVKGSSLETKNYMLSIIIRINDELNNVRLVEQVGLTKNLGLYHDRKYNVSANEEGDNGSESESSFSTEDSEVGRLMHMGEVEVMHCHQI